MTEAFHSTALALRILSVVVVQLVAAPVHTKSILLDAALHHLRDAWRDSEIARASARKP
jgi:hypothetical protein